MRHYTLLVKPIGHKETGDVLLAKSTVQHGSAYTVVRSTSQSYGDNKISGVQNSQTPEPIDKNLAWVITLAMTPRMPKFKTIAPLEEWRRMREISTSRDFQIYTSRAYATMSVSVCLSVCLSVTEVHWRIIANLGFKFRSTFTAHCGRCACWEDGRDHRWEERRDNLALCYPLLGPLVSFPILSYTFSDPKFCSCPETKPQNTDFYAVCFI